MFAKTSYRVLAVTAASALALTACGTTNSNSSGNPTGGSSSAGCTHNIAYLGAATGPNGALGQNMIGGIKLALSKYNKSHASAKVCLKTFDSQGDKTQAATLAPQIVHDASIVALIGPGFSGESKATGATFFQAGLPSISPSATNVTLTQNGWTTWHRVIGNDAAQGAADGKYILNKLKAKKVIVIQDDSDYGIGLATVVKSTLGSAVVATDKVSTGQTDFSATVSHVQSSGATVLFYGGYYAESGLLAKQLRQAGWKGTFVSGDGSEDPKFVSTAGASAANGALLSAPAGPAPASFNTEYQALIGSPAGLYSTQAYDATNIVLAGLEAGKTSHSDLNSFIGSYTGQGISGPIAFDSKGDIKQSVIYMYTVKNGVLDVAHPTAIS
ncbi:MAG: branched-chain amino acid ABC transporter substrate-binding protein [Marmoricola sp.]